MAVYDKEARKPLESMTSTSNVPYDYDNNKNTRGTEYFSGSNVKVYFGSVRIEPIAAIQFTLQEQIVPIYGFHSYTFDRISRGQRIVQGSFTLNFTENGYLQTVLDRIALEMRSGMAQIDSSGNGAQASFASPNEDSATAEANTIERILSAGETGTYEDYLASLKNSFWGNTDTSRISRASEAKESDVYFYAQENGQTDENPLREHGFNVLIDYSPDANLSDFEACLKNLRAAGDTKSLFQSYRTLIGVHITGVSESIDTSGQVLQQHYQFIARDLDGDITAPSLETNYRYDTQTISFTLPPKKSAAPRGIEGVNGVL